MRQVLLQRRMDLAWLGLLLTTFAVWIVLEGAVDSWLQAPVLMGLMVVKSGLILAIFMDLIRHSWLALAAVLAFMSGIGVLVVALI